MFKGLAVLVGCVALVACTTAQPAAFVAVGDIEKASDAFHATRTKGDAAAFAAMFTDDGMFMVPGLPDATGRTEISDLAAKRFASTKTIAFKVLRREIQPAADSAHELGWFTEDTRSGDQGFRMEGRYLIVWKRGTDNVWRAQRYLYAFSGASPLG